MLCSSHGEVFSGCCCVLICVQTDLGACPLVCVAPDSLVSVQGVCFGELMLPWCLGCGLRCQTGPGCSWVVWSSILRVCCVVVCIRQVRVLVPVRWTCSGFGPVGSSCRLTSSRCGRGGCLASLWSKLGRFFSVKRLASSRFCWSLFVSAQFAVLGVIADSEYVDSMGTVGRRCSMPTLVGLV